MVQKMDITLKLFAEENDIKIPKPMTWEYSDVFLLAYRELWSEVDEGKRFFHKEELREFFKTYADWIEHLEIVSYDSEKRRTRMAGANDTIFIVQEYDSKTGCCFCGEEETIVKKVGGIVLNVCYACSVTVEDDS